MCVPILLRCMGRDVPSSDQSDFFGHISLDATSKVALSSIATVASLYALAYTASGISIPLLLSGAALLLSSAYLITSAVEYFSSRTFDDDPELVHELSEAEDPDVDEAEEVHDHVELDIDRYYGFLNYIVESQDAEQFRDAFVNLNLGNKKHIAANLAVRLLENRVSDLEKVHPERAKYEFILENLKIVYPELQNYFQPRYPGQGLFSTPLKPTAIQLVFDELSQKRSLRDLETTVCSTYSEFENSLLEVLTRAARPSFTRHALVFRHCTGNQQDDEQPHVSPIYVDKQLDRIRIFSTDGGMLRTLEEERKKPTWNKIIIEIVKKVCEQAREELGLASFPAQLYVYTGERRHKDRINCPVFGIRDIVHMAQEPGISTRWIVDHSQPHPHPYAEGVQMFTLAVPRMMKLTQSLTQLRKFQAELGFDPVIKAGTRKAETLSNSIARNTKRFYEIKQNKVKDQNVKTARAYLKYERMVIRRVISSF